MTDTLRFGVFFGGCSARTATPWPWTTCVARWTALMAGVGTARQQVRSVGDLALELSHVAELHGDMGVYFSGVPPLWCNLKGNEQRINFGLDWDS